MLILVDYQHCLTALIFPCDTYVHVLHIKTYGFPQIKVGGRFVTGDRGHRHVTTEKYGVVPVSQTAGCDVW